jgi:transposase
VITGALGRRRWSADAKARIVAKSLAPGVVISEVARRHDVRPQQLSAWRHQARQGRLALPAAELDITAIQHRYSDARVKMVPSLECAAPGAGQDQAAGLTVCRAWWSSNWAGLR